jgi:hypothetical protein
VIIIKETGKIKRLYVDEQRSLGYIAKMFNVSPGKISSILWDLEVPLRGIGGREGMKMPKGHSSMEKNPNWKGGIKKLNGRVLVKAPSHPKANNQGYVMRSHLVLESNGVVIPNGFHVHHKDEVRDHDSPENLEPLTNSEHRKLHCETQSRDKTGKFGRVAIS